MGEAKRRGTYTDRKAVAIASGRVKKQQVKKRQMSLKTFGEMLLEQLWPK